MPLADTTSIQFTSPIFVALLSPWLLGERTPREVWLTTALALLGVCILLRPNLAALGLAALLPVMAALGLALLVIFTRQMPAFSVVLALHFWVGIIATPFLVAGTF